MVIRKKICTHIRSQQYLRRIQLQVAFVVVYIDCRVQTFTMYDIHEDTSSDNHAYFESPANSLYPPVILLNLARFSQSVICRLSMLR